MGNTITRLRRLRRHPAMRELVTETRLHPSDFILPLYVHHGQGVRQEIPSMPGCFQLSIDELAKEIEAVKKLGLQGVIVFGIPEEKDPIGQDAMSDEGIVQQAVRAIKQQVPDLLVITDVCCCEYTDHGHCGIINEKTGKPDVDNDETLTLLGKQAVSHAKAGANVVAPSGMMDGAVKAIRTALDENGFTHIPILGYSVKFASALYGPFRFAVDSVPSFGDRRTYQMNPANANIAMREAQTDVEEGADMIMVKPAHAYLDIIYRVKQAHPNVPLCAYHISGEYVMIKAAAEKNWLDEKKAALEIHLSIKRAGADFIITNYAKELVGWLRE